MDRLSHRAKRVRDVAAALGRRRALAERERRPRERLERSVAGKLQLLVADAAAG